MGAVDGRAILSTVLRAGVAAALMGLAAHWRADARAVPALRAAFDSSDPEIRTAVMPTQRPPARSGGSARSGR